MKKVNTQEIMFKTLITTIILWTLLTCGLCFIWRFIYFKNASSNYAGSLFQFVDIIKVKLGVVPYLIWMFLGGLITSLTSALLSCYVFNSMLMRYLYDDIYN